MILISTVNDHAAPQNGPSYIEPVQGADVSACFTDSGAETTERAGNIVQLAVESDGERSGREMCHREYRGYALKCRLNQIFYVNPGRPSSRVIVDL
jgi:hypothetical protein